MDFAARWFHTLSVFDIGVSHFSGTSREPELRPILAGKLAPYYPVIDQTGLDIQATIGGWLFKFEGITRSGFGLERYSALGTGFEYTFGNVAQTGVDIGLVGEYFYDEREKSWRQRLLRMMFSAPCVLH